MVECLTALLLISGVGMAAFLLLGSYYRESFSRDQQMQALIQNTSAIEQLKTQVEDLSELYAFSKNHPLRVVAIGVGEVEMKENPDGSIRLKKTADEAYDFTLPGSHLYRIEIGGETPNSKLITIMRLEG